MASEELKLRYARKWIVRNYPAGDAEKLAALKALAIEVNATATDTITLTSLTLEAGQATGAVTFEKVIIGLAIEEWLEQIDPDFVAAPELPQGFAIRFSPC